ncbi:MAG: threonine--tRNA ligase, partial [Nanoarchaeota archaeon]
EFAPGFPFFHEKGAIIWNEVEKYLRDLYERNCYKFVITPLIMDKKIWLQSGHWEHFKENMYFTKIEDREFAVKPMNCPGHILIYKQHLHSYKDLPIRMAEFGTVHRNELSGVIHGLTRVRKMTQDDAHIFSSEDQIENEISGILDLIKEIYNVFDFKDYDINLSTKPENSMGDPKVWDKAEKALENALKKSKLKYEVNNGEGAFYGPKIDFDVNDALGRPWQLATIQLDFQMPERFDLSYEGADGKKHRPVMIHRAIIGSFERFMGVLIEHYAGKFPLWLAPTQVVLMTVTDRNLKFAKEFFNELKNSNIRVELDDRNESIGKKVRDAQINRIPLAITIGDKESDNKTLAVRTLDGKVKFGVKMDDFLKDISNKIKNRSD